MLHGKLKREYVRRDGAAVRGCDAVRPVAAEDTVCGLCWGIGLERCFVLDVVVEVGGAKTCG